MLLKAKTSEDLIKVVDIAKLNLMKNSVLKMHVWYNQKNIEILVKAYFKLRLPEELGGIAQHHWDLAQTINPTEFDYVKEGNVWKYIEEEYSSGKFDLVLFNEEIKNLKEKYEYDNETITFLDEINKKIIKIPSHQGGRKKKKTKKKRKKRKNTRRKKRKKRKKTRKKKRKVKRNKTRRKK